MKRSAKRQRFLSRLPLYAILMVHTLTTNLQRPKILDVELTYSIPTVEAIEGFSPTNHLAHRMEQLGHKKFVFNSLRCWVMSCQCTNSL